MPERWTYSRIRERARADAVFDHMFGGSSAFDGTVDTFNKARDARDYKYNYDQAKMKEERGGSGVVDRPRRRVRRDRGI